MNLQNANLSSAPAVASASFNIQDTSNTNNAAPAAGATTKGINNYSKDQQQRDADDTQTPTPQNQMQQHLAVAPVTIMVHCESNCANHKIDYEENN